MIFIVAGVSLLITAITNYCVVIAVSEQQKKEQSKNYFLRIKSSLLDAKNTIVTDKKWILKKQSILSLIFAVLSTVGICLVVLSSNNWIAIVRYSIMFFLLSPIAIVDCFTKKIFNKVVLSALILRVLIFIPEFIFFNKDFVKILIASFIGLLVGFVLLAILSAISRGGMGMGDVKIIAVLGFYTGIATMFYTLVLGMFCCFFYCLYLIIVKKKNKKYELAFGPFILIGLVLSMVIR